MNAKAIGLSKTIINKQPGYFTGAGVELEASKFATSAAVRTSAKKIGEKVAADAMQGMTAGCTITIEGNQYRVSAYKAGSNLIGSGSVKSAIAKLYSNKVKVGLKNSVASQSFVGARVDNYEIANATITKIQDAINNVSTQRSALGALQNRLEHTIANLDNVSENTQAAESRIRDTDMASEMVEYSKNNILAQAGQSMLAQANQSTQGVLSLLQ